MRCRPRIRLNPLLFAYARRLNSARVMGKETRAARWPSFRLDPFRDDDDDHSNGSKGQVGEDLETLQEAHVGYDDAVEEVQEGAHDRLVRQAVYGSADACGDKVKDKKLNASWFEANRRYCDGGTVMEILPPQPGT